VRPYWKGYLKLALVSCRRLNTAVPAVRSGHDPSLARHGSRPP
jgi:hypothetical protein